MLGEVRETDRGFEKVAFKDDYDKECSLQQSSAIGTCPTPGGSFVWLGMNSPDCPMVRPENLPPMFCRMHLNREQVFDLIQLLTNWHNTGSFKEK